MPLTSHIIYDIWQIFKCTYVSIYDLFSVSLIYNLYLCQNFILSSIVIFHPCLVRYVLLLSSYNCLRLPCEFWNHFFKFCNNISLMCWWDWHWIYINRLSTRKRVSLIFSVSLIIDILFFFINTLQFFCIKVLHNLGCIYSLLPIKSFSRYHT